MRCLIINSLEQWIIPGYSYTFALTKEAWLQIDKACNHADNIETGGILIGYYCNENSMALVTEVTGPSIDSLQNHSNFKRGINGLKALLNKLWTAPCKSYYLGEWHYHPSLYLEPSENDFHQMEKISTRKEYNCSEPIMLITGKENNSKRSCRVFLFPQGKSHLEFFRDKLNGTGIKS